MSVSQKMFACSGLMLVSVLMFAQAIPVPVPEDVHPEYGRFAAAQIMASESGGPVSVEVVDPAAVVRPARSASPFFGILAGYERPHKSHHHSHHHEEEYEPYQHHRPSHHRPEHHQQQHGGGGAGSFASAGSFAGGAGGGHSQSSANSQSASFGFGPFQASYSASSAHSGSKAGGGGSYFDY